MERSWSEILTANADLKQKIGYVDFFSIFNQNHDLSLTVTKCFSSLNLAHETQPPCPPSFNFCASQEL